ncbi:MAG: hypothetical protein QOD39_1760 [Mycobacterium sp.]|nr:hypothetical protein [Mycobacterium sp.]
MKNLIARGGWVVAVIAAVASMALLGAGAAHADALIGKTYEDARATVSDKWHSTPVLSTVNGDQTDLDQCLVASWSKSSAVSALGENNGSKVLLNLNCNAKVAEAGKPGNSAMTPQGKSAKADNKVATRIAANPEKVGCFKNDDNLAYCKRVCARTGLCEIDS